MVAIKAMNLQPDEVHEIVSEVNTLSQVIAPLYTLGIWVSSINIDCSEILWHFFFVRGELQREELKCMVLEHN